MTKNSLPSDPAAYETESQLVADILLAFGALSWLWVWRENTGRAYGVGLVKTAVKLLMMGRLQQALGILKGLQPIIFGIPGRADISGIIQGGRMFAVECKIKGRKRTDEQVLWAEKFISMGGLYVHAETVEDVWAAVRAAGYPCQ